LVLLRQGKHDNTRIQILKLILRNGLRCVNYILCQIKLPNEKDGATTKANRTVMRQEPYFTGWCLTSSSDAGNIDAGTFIVRSQYMVRNDGAFVVQD
jgi:hypothetical protein